MSNKMNMNKASLDTSLAALTLNRDGARPLHAQIVEQLRRLILSGAAASGALGHTRGAIAGRASPGKHLTTGSRVQAPQRSGTEASGKAGPAKRTLTRGTAPRGRPWRCTARHRPERPPARPDRRTSRRPIGRAAEAFGGESEGHWLPNWRGCVTLTAEPL